MASQLRVRAFPLATAVLLAGACLFATACAGSPEGESTAGEGSTAVASVTSGEGGSGTLDETSGDGSGGSGTGEIDLDCEPAGVDRVEVPDGVLIVENPQALLQFCGVREIVGHLVIGSEDTSVLWGGLGALARLEVIEGLELRSIEEPVALPSLRAAEFLTLQQPASVTPPLLPRLQDVGSIFVGAHASPVDLSALESARDLRIGGQMVLDALTELQGFSVSAGVVSLPEAPQLERITGAVQLDGPADLEDLALLRNVRTIEGRLELLNLTSLTSLSDLSALERVGKAESAGTDTFPSGGLRLHQLDALPSLAGLEALSVIHGDIDISQENRTPSLQGLQGVTAWRADGRMNVEGTSLGVHAGGEGVEPRERALLGWLERAELPSPCVINVEMPPSKVDMVDFDPELAALCEG